MLTDSLGGAPYLRKDIEGAQRLTQVGRKSTVEVLKAKVNLRKHYLARCFRTKVRFRELIHSSNEANY